MKHPQEKVQKVKWSHLTWFSNGSQFALSATYPMINALL